MVDKQALHDDLTTAFMNYQYNLENPLSCPSKEDLHYTYIQDYMFHNRVESMVGGVMSILDKHI